MQITRNTTLIFALGLLLLVAVGVLSFRNVQNQDADRGWVSHTYQVIGTIGTIQTELATQKDSWDRYLLTGSPEYLGLLTESESRLEASLAEAAELTADNPSQQQNVDDLRRLAGEERAVWQGAVVSGKSTAVSSAQTRVEELGAQIQIRVEKMKALETGLLEERRATANKASQNTKIAIGGGSLLAILLFLASGVTIHRELKERRQAELQLHNSEERFRIAVSDVLNYAILTLDATGHVADWNAGAERIKGYRPEEIIGKHFSIFYPEEDVKNGKPQRELEIASREGRVEDEGWRVRKDGSRFWGSVMITAMRSRQGELIGFSKVSRDMTEQKKTEEEIRKLNHALSARVAELTTINRELDAFTYSLAHDLRAPLRHIHGFTSILAEEWAPRMDDEGRRIFDKILRSSREMGTLIDELLGFAQLGRVDLALGRVDLSRVVEDVKHRLEPDAQNRTVEWQIGKLPIVMADLALLRQVFTNLLSNALKYSSKRDISRIEVGSRNGGDEIVVFVRDNGAGFEMEYADRLFGVFQRLHRQEEFEGTGVGLANVRRIIERHGGRVWAEGSPGQGATFYFSLPA